MKLQYSLAAAGLLLFSSVSLMGETAQEQAKRRISPVNRAMDVNGSVRCLGFNGGQSYEIKWQMVGYDSNYTTALVIFDCTGKTGAPLFECGASYSEAAAEGSVVGVYLADYVTDADADWTYWDNQDHVAYARDFNYSVTFTFPASSSYSGPWGTAADNNSTPLVFRWYQIAEGEPSGEPLISILLGSEAGYHYGNNARRIESNVSTDVDPFYECPQMTP